MTNYPISTRTQLPDEFQTLLKDYPREAWEKHPDMAPFTQNWLEAHAMFRRLDKIIVKDTQKFLDKSRSGEDFAKRIGFYGGQLVDNLTRHHHFEDEQFFPTISSVTPDFDRGLKMLESDHEALTKAMEDFVISGNSAIDLAVQDDAQAIDAAGKVLEKAQALQDFLTRHLADEEDLVVPILLHHKMR